MEALGYWHPVVLDRELKRAPVKVELWGREIALFRDDSGRARAVDNACPHRGMRLSAGHVEGCALVCPYHGWRFDGCGRGFAPSQPQRKVSTGSYDVEERAGAIWIRRAGSDAAFPELFEDGLEVVTALHTTIDAPFELLLDNFTEVEHWPTVHQFLGYAMADIGALDFKVERSERSVHVVAKGPQKPLPWALQRMIGVRDGDPFVEEWTTYFEPVYTVYRHWWTDPETGKERGERMHFANFFNPIDERRTQLFVFAFMDSARLRRPLVRHVYRRLMEQVIRREVALDRGLVEQLAHRGPSLAGLHLGPLDRAIVANRKLIDRIYRPGPTARTPAQNP